MMSFCFLGWSNVDHKSTHDLQGVNTVKEEITFLRGCDGSVDN